MFRRAFSVSELVSDEHVAEVIARRMLGSEEEKIPTQARAAVPADRSTFSDTLDDARRHVLAFLAAAKSGELDLAISGFGVIVPATGHVGEWRKSAEDSAIEVMTAALLPDESPSYRAHAWFEWLWDQLTITPAEAD